MRMKSLTALSIALGLSVLLLLAAAAAIGTSQAVGGDVDSSANEGPEPVTPITDDDRDDDPSANEGLNSVMPITENDRLEQIAKENPGFGGYFRDRDDRSIVTVLMTDVSKREVAERAAHAAVKDPELIREVRIVKADFEFTDLAEWYRLLKEHLWVAVDEITSSCISGDTNRIEIGISDLSARDKVTKVLNELGIPVNAVTIEEFAGVRKLSDYRGIGRGGFIIILAAVGTFVCLGMAVSGYWLLKRKRGAG